MEARFFNYERPYLTFIAILKDFQKKIDQEKYVHTLMHNLKLLFVFQ